MLMNRNNTVIYVGVTNNIIRRTLEHKNKVNRGFTNDYNVDKLVYFEKFDYIWIAIKREKQLKAGSRARKLKLIKSLNPAFKDLFYKLVSEDSGVASGLLRSPRRPRNDPRNDCLIERSVYAECHCEPAKGG